MATTPQAVPKAPRTALKVVVLTLVACAALLVGTMAVFVRFFGAFMAYSPVPMTVDGVGRFEEARRQLARDSTEYTRWVGLADVALWSVDAGEPVKALEYADEALAMLPAYRRDWNYGNVIHKANLAKGRVALRAGQPKLAAKFLLAAGATPGSPQLNSFGPNMLLAQEMLAAGERDAVLRYIDLCGTFWEMDAGALWAWKRIVNAGGTPNFGANLLY